MKKGFFVLLSLANIAHADIPVFRFTPLTSTAASVSPNSTATVKYLVTNQSHKTHTLIMTPIVGVTQDVSGGNCKNPFVLAYMESCTLSLSIDGANLEGDIIGGPVVCQQGGVGLECYHPSRPNQLQISLQNIGSISLSSASPNFGPNIGGSGVTLTGTGLIGATSVTFGGVPATIISNTSTTVQVATPAHAEGPVDIVITTPSGSATLSNGFTYQTYAIGDLAYGGKIACNNGGLNNLIAATADNSSSIEWGGGTLISGATSVSDGAANTTAIVNALGNNGGVPYAAKLCSDYAVDAFGNSCTPGSAGCYDDWFLPAYNFSNPLDPTDQLQCLWDNQSIVH